MNLELKQVALILTLLMPAVGFYYTTNVRLEALGEIKMPSEEQDLVIAEMTKTVVTLDRGMQAMYMLVVKHDEQLKDLLGRVESLEILLQVSRGDLVQ